jgi:SAM-dependent methyltransferase
MWTDVVDLHAFYSSSLGAVTQRLIGRRIHDLWPSLKGQRLLGVGYATPYLNFYLGETERTLAFMPAQQGVLPWPEQGPCLTTLIEEDDIPLPDQSIDRILLVHSLEYADQIRPFLREIWRVLSIEGRLLVIVPNRRGLWARVDGTPFGQGQPYTMTQLSRLLRDAMFTPLNTKRGLYCIPSRSRLVQASSPVFEKVGDFVFRKFCGVICIEATKQIYAGSAIKPRRSIHLPSFIGLQPS